MSDSRGAFVEGLAERLDAEGWGLGRVQGDFSGWLIWYSGRTGCYHARRDDPSGRFTEHEHDPRRFHVSATTLGRLVVLLLAQVALDAAVDTPESKENVHMEKRADAVASWSAHHIPDGTPVRYLVSATDEETPIRLVFGAADQLELELPVSAVEPIVRTLQAAATAARARCDEVRTAQATGGD